MVVDDVTGVLLLLITDEGIDFSEGVDDVDVDVVIVVDGALDEVVVVDVVALVIDGALDDDEVVVVPVVDDALDEGGCEGNIVTSSSSTMSCLWSRGSRGWSSSITFLPTAGGALEE